MQAPKVSYRLLLVATLLVSAAANAAAGTWFTVAPNGNVSVNREAAPQAPLNGVLLNPQPARSNGRGSGNYLIVTASSYAGSGPLTQFADHKTAKGFTVSTYSVPSGTHRSAIKSYIESLWGGPDAPDYILLVGDTDGATSTSTTIPHWVGGGTKSATTDLPYACMDPSNPWYPDIAIGRYSVRSVATLQDVVDKTLCLEGGVYPDPTYRMRAVFAATNDQDSEAEETHDWVIANYMDPANYESIKIYGAQGGDTQDVTNAVNAGCMFLVYGGHSHSGGWSYGVPVFLQNDVRNLSNADMYPFYFGWSCNTAHFDYDECFGETWLREADKGAAAFLSASTYIYYGGAQWESSRRLEKYLFEAIFGDGIWEVGPAWHAALYKFLADPDYGPSNPVTRNMFEMFVLLGDPALLLPGRRHFWLDVDPGSQLVCSPPSDEAVYTIDVVPLDASSRPVTLSASGEPAEADVSFSVNPVTPPGTSVMTIGNLMASAPGAYTIQISGTQPGGYEELAFVELHLEAGVPGTVALISPAKNATDVSRTPTLIWQEAPQANEYDIEVATDSEFVDIVYAVTVAEPPHTLTDRLEALTDYYWHVRGVNGCGEGAWSQSRHFTTLEQDDYFTEEFTGDFDLDYSTIVFYPDGTGDYYGVCGGPASELPTDPSGGTPLYPGEDGYESVFLEFSQTASLYGLGYTTFYVCANGYITFDGGDSDPTPTLEDHFSMPRISALFSDLSPQNGTVSWMQLGDRAVVTFEDVPEYGTSNSNTFQVEMYYAGEIHITWLGIDSSSSIVGISQGNGLPDDYIETDLSAVAACNPEPPVAEDDSASTPANIPVSITLTATDDGLPDPPAALTYIIVSLPSEGMLSDPGAGDIDSVPYTLVAGGNQVTYTPNGSYVGDDSFTFKANDGGAPPEGGDSNIATITISVTPAEPELVYTFSLDADPGWTTEGQWAFGQPTGGGSHDGDPTAGYTGSNVYGYNLDGDYPSDMPAPDYLTTLALDCTDLIQVELRFWRWLGVDSSDFDHASIEVSNDNTQWTEIWSNPVSSISDSTWSQILFDISAVADHQPTVYIRWGMGPTDSGTTYPGWNIDDIEIWATPQCLGDLDGDNDVDVADLAELLANYGMTSGAQYGDGDLDGDGDVDIADLAALLAVYGTVCD